MGTDISLTWTDCRRPAEDSVCPLQIKSLRTDEETCLFTWDKETLTESSCEERTPGSGRGTMGEEAIAMETSEDELGRLDIDLDRKSKQHNLTSRNVRTILHEVITHEHVVAMMKAAIRDTQDLPMFEPKMTRSRLKQAVQQGQVLSWSQSAVNMVKHPQFVDIDLEEDEDSSDEEYCPDEEEEEDEDTVEETLLSDADALASPPKVHQCFLPKVQTEQRTDQHLQRSPGFPIDQVIASTCAPQHLITTPSEPSFMDRLNAVEEELDCSPAYTYNQGAADSGADEDCLAYRTRSKLPLVNVPLGQLEAELLAPDITADMYDQSTAQQDEDRHWTEWLQGLMAPDNEEEADDDDDPEYNFLDDLDEPDQEDYRTDRAVQITKKEVNELLEELFDTLHEVEDVAAEEEEEEIPPKIGPKFNVPQALRFEAPLAGMLKERRQTVRKRYEALQQRRALQDTSNHHHDGMNLKRPTPSPDPNTITRILVVPGQACPTLYLDYTQKLQLQQQIQQHVQLLTQVYLLSRRIDALNHEAGITKQYLEELQQFSCRREAVFLPSTFRVCNLQGALDLIQEVEQREEPPPALTTSRRWLPRMSPVTNSHAFPLLPADTTWLFATRPIFLYSELLPVCSLDPALHRRHQRSIYTPGEDGLIVLGLKHFEGTVQSDQLISSYLLRKNRWNFRKHIREMCSQRAPPNNVIKTFLTEGFIPPLPLACRRVSPGDQCPPVDRNPSSMPNWLKNSRQIIQRTRLDSSCYPPSLPPGCTLRLHPYWLNKSRPPAPPHRRLFTLAHNASLLPLAKAPADVHVERQVQPINCLSLPPLDIGIHSDTPSVPAAVPLVPPPICGTLPLAAVYSVPAHCQTVSRERSTPLLLPLPSLSNLDTTNPIFPLAPAAAKPGCFLLQMVWAKPTDSFQQALGLEPNGQLRQEQEEGDKNSMSPWLKVEERQGEDETSASTSTLSPQSSSGEKDEEEQQQVEVEKGEDLEVKEKEMESENLIVMGVVSLNGGESTVREGEQGTEGGGGGAGGEEEEEDGGGEGEQGGEGEGEEAEGQREDGGEEREDDGEKEKDDDHDRQGEEEEEEDFDDLTQDEDEEEVMSSASEESVLSVPELQETMKQLTWLAAERRLCADGDSEEDHSPTSEEEEDEGGHKEAGSVERRGSKGEEDEEAQSEERTHRGGGGRCPGRGRGRSRPLRGLRRSRQERHTKDAAKLLLLYDENLLENDPHRESKDMAFAQSYLNRVREAMQDVPGQVEEFVSLLNEFEQVGEGQEVVSLFRKLCCILGDRTDLLRDFAAFLHPEQALQCGLFEEQQAFERSRRFLRQLEISFGDNPSHYQKIIKALQTGPDLSPTSIHELKAQMATLLKGHTHLQAEFWVFFDELRPPPARPGQFEEAHWPEDGGGGSDGGEGGGQVSVGGSSGGFEEVTLPELEEEDEGHKIQPMTGRRRRRKLEVHRNYKDCDWSDKDWLCTCRDAKIRGHRRKGCSCKTSGVVSRALKSLDPLYSQISSSHMEQGDKESDLKGDDDSPQPDRSSASWEGPFHLTDEKEEEEEEEEMGEEEDDEEEEEKKNSEKEQSLAVKRSRRDEALHPSLVTTTCSTSSTITTSSVCSTSISTSFSVTPSIFTSVTPSVSIYTSSAPPQPGPPPDPPVCAKNISLTASGEKVILWTREADRVILTTCQQEGANQNTFQAISNLLGNKTPGEVSRRFRDLMRLFRTAARQTSSEDESPPNDTTAANHEGNLSQSEELQHQKKLERY
ncbi:GON-4-like protein isoform X2 [Anabas testudineus]|uniref:GON-4-like protein isoform X2 n=1 Tax=Anabas testudineus TaxID=64144 RepID=UPI000E45855B|nr:GON-4-like protein isoform X2 [Anabas testudineus]